MVKVDTLIKGPQRPLSPGATLNKTTMIYDTKSHSTARSYHPDSGRIPIMRVYYTRDIFVFAIVSKFVVLYVLLSKDFTPVHFVRYLNFSGDDSWVSILLYQSVTLLVILDFIVYF